MSAYLSSGQLELGLYALFKRYGRRNGVHLWAIQGRLQLLAVLSLAEF